MCFVMYSFATQKLAQHCSLCAAGGYGKQRIRVLGEDLKSVEEEFFYSMLTGE